MEKKENGFNLDDILLSSEKDNELLDNLIGKDKDFKEDSEANLNELFDILNTEAIEDEKDKPLEKDIEKKAPPVKEKEEVSDDFSSIASPLLNFSTFLSEEGVLDSPLDEEEINTKGIAALKEKVEQTIENRIKKYVEELPEDKQKMVMDKLLTKLPPELKDLYQNYDSEVPVTQLLAVRAKQIDLGRITNEDLEDNEGLQKSIIKHLMLLKGSSEEEINTDIELYEQNNILRTKSLKALETIKNHYKNEEIDLVNKAKAERNTTIKNIESYINGLKEVIPDMELTPKLKEQVMESIKSVVRLDNGIVVDKVRAKMIQDPVKYTSNLHILDTLGLLDLDWSKVSTKVRSKVTKEFEKSLDSFTNPSMGKRTQKIIKDNEWDSFLKKFETT